MNTIDLLYPVLINTSYLNSATVSLGFVRIWKGSLFTIPIKIEENR
tara:strand:- start:4 stop:141 length:138 start_codon:yes stop_codon:yes gene_type:complete